MKQLITVLFAAFLNPGLNARTESNPRVTNGNIEYRPSLLSRKGKAMREILVGLMVISICLSSTTQTSAQIALDKNTLRTVRAVGSAAAGIPYIGPFLSAATKFLFKAPDEPSYAEMKMEWEGYTDQKILEERKTSLRHDLDGYRGLIKEIEIRRQEEADLNAREAGGLPVDEARHKRYNDEKIKKWEDIETLIIAGLPHFNFEDPNQPVAPLLLTYGSIINLHIDSLDRVARLSRKYDKGKIGRQAKGG
jgi:hypothetical protein